MPIKTAISTHGRIVLECVHADTCFPDYWGGHHLPHVQIPVHKGMTLKRIKADLIAELRFGYVSGSGAAARLMNFVTTDDAEQAQADALIRAAIAAVRRMRLAVPGTRRLFLDLEETDFESVYAFFVFRDL